MSTVNSDDEVEGKACRLMLTEPIEWITYPSLFQIARVLAHLILVLGEDKGACGNGGCFGYWRIHDGGALDTAKKLPSFIKLYLRNRPL
ncbi:hypothetical protein HPP92_028574 [Vanilla planifolia]|uniref:Uncharacterized protein n=1 Tax=Vanilla planifolia TaxID=51239 RepID=A0A835U3Y3_VANPL|nr:hypothetical protein HPP92_028574 [Vanilla planifolia]